MSDTLEALLASTTLVPTSVVDEMRGSYSSYALSVVVSRALPDVRDGLKPVHRRILYSMHEEGRTSERPHVKSARIVGDVMGKYHPHGDASIYDALVRLAQPFSLGMPLIDGQGNFGSVDDDPPAAMRYTESRLTALAQTLLTDIDQNCVIFGKNYDETEEEPTVLPARFPNVLVNGGEGIAVGFASKIPPHNLGEVCAGTLALLADATCSEDRLAEMIQGPDFPTGGVIVGYEGIARAQRTGSGSVRLRARHYMQEGPGGRISIVFDQLPYQVVKKTLINEIEQKIVRPREENPRAIPGIVEVIDESDRNALKIVVKLRPDADADAVLAQLFATTRLEINYPVNCTVLNDGLPKVMSYKNMLLAFLKFRRETVKARTIFYLRRARRIAHLRIGQMLAVSRIEDVVRALRTSGSTEASYSTLEAMEFADPGGVFLDLWTASSDLSPGPAPYRLSRDQIQDILKMPIGKLAGFERADIEEKAREDVVQIRGYIAIIADPSARDMVIRDEIESIVHRFGHDRRTAIVVDPGEQDAALRVPRRTVVLIVTKDGWAKRIDAAEFRSQGRGGIGRTGAAPRAEDAAEHLMACNSRDHVLVFTSHGKVFATRAWRFPEAGMQGRGRPLVNLLKLADDERVVALLAVEDTRQTESEILLINSQGRVRRNAWSDFDSIPTQGKRAWPMDAGELVGAVQVQRGSDLILASRAGQTIRFAVSNALLRLSKSRSGRGVRGLRLASGDEIVSFCLVPSMPFLPGEAALYLSNMRKDLPESAEDNEGIIQDATEVEQADADGVEDEEEELGLATPIPLEPEDLTGLDPEARQAMMVQTDRILAAVSADGLGRRFRAHSLRRVGRGGTGQGSGFRPVLPMVGVVEAGTGDLLLLTQQGRVLRTPVDSLRVGPRRGQGVRLVRLPEDDRVVSVTVLPSQEEQEPSEEENYA